MINPTKLQKAEGKNTKSPLQFITSSKQLHCGLGGKEKNGQIVELQLV
jgi:hypothetical protein